MFAVIGLFLANFSAIYCLAFEDKLSCIFDHRHRHKLWSPPILADECHTFYTSNELHFSFKKMFIPHQFCAGKEYVLNAKHTHKIKPRIGGLFYTSLWVFIWRECGIREGCPNKKDRKTFEASWNKRWLDVIALDRSVQSLSLCHHFCWVYSTTLN